MKRILDAIANGGIDSLEGIDRAFGRIAAGNYDPLRPQLGGRGARATVGHAPPQKRSQKP